MNKLIVVFLSVFSGIRLAHADPCSISLPTHFVEQGWEQQILVASKGTSIDRYRFLSSPPDCIVILQNSRQARSYLGKGNVSHLDIPGLRAYVFKRSASELLKERTEAIAAAAADPRNELLQEDFDPGEILLQRKNLLVILYSNGKSEDLSAVKSFLNANMDKPGAT